MNMKKTVLTLCALLPALSAFGAGMQDGDHTMRVMAEVEARYQENLSKEAAEGSSYEGLPWPNAVAAYRPHLAWAAAADCMDTFGTDRRKICTCAGKAVADATLAAAEGNGGEIDENLILARCKMPGY